MRLEFVNRVKENEILGKNIYTDDGRVLLKAGTKLIGSYIERIKNLGVFYVYIEDERLIDVAVEDQELSKLKQVVVKNMSPMIKSIYNKNKSEMNESLHVLEELIDYIISLGDVNKSLFEIQTADNHTYMHSLGTCIMSVFLGVSMKLKKYDIQELGLAAILHDIGKIKVPYSIISKRGTLSDEETEELKKHPIYGEEILKKIITIPEPVIRAVAQHHERVDGRGYPLKLKGHQIGKYAKIISLCDVYDTISNDRYYKNNFRPHDAYELIMANSGTMFDEEIVKNFRETFAVYPLGSCVRLSDGVEGYVIKQNANFPDRPVIRVLYEGETKKPIPFYEVDLLQKPNVIVVAVV